ncbi:MAG: hypothetical protein SNH94_00625 [Rikenellaceae bacterium]
MKRILIFAATLLLATELKAQSEDVKTGWNFGPFPAVSYNSDLGFQYGVFGEIFYFGDGSTFPQYQHKFTVEASAYTKGSTVLNFGYDSKYLIPNIRTTFTVSYLPDTMMSFYGFNGYMNPYNSEQGESFYSVDRKYFRTYLDFQAEITKNFNWAAGLGFYSYEISPVQIEKYADAPSLFAEYIDAGLISADETAGKHLELRAGLVHDSRDSEADPYSGFFTELLAVASPDLFEGEEASFAQLSLVHRGYLPVVGDKLTFAYRLLCQATIYGEVPFYHQQNLTTLLLRKTYSEGLGGYSSIRGMLRNRAVGLGYAVANAELRYRFCNFNFIGQKWYLAANPFFDLGQVIQKYRASEMIASGNSLIYSGNDESLHTTAGIGSKIVMNRNFILNAEFGKTLNEQDGDNSLILGLSFLF